MGEYQKATTVTLKEILQEDLRDLQEKIEKRTQLAQQDLQEKQVGLLKPIQDKLKKTIETVAKEKGYSIVLENSSGVIMYGLDTDNLTQSVKTKLGVKDKPVTLPGTTTSPR